MKNNPMIKSKFCKRCKKLFTYKKQHEGSAKPMYCKNCNKTYTIYGNTIGYEYIEEP